MAFGRLTVRNYDKKIQMLTNETGAESTIITGMKKKGQWISSVLRPKGWRADEAFAFEAGDRVLVQGKAFIRRNDRRAVPGQKSDELSVTASGLFRIGRTSEDRTTCSRYEYPADPQE